MNEMYKKWFRNLIIMLVLMLVLISGLVVMVDPYFHYHKPIFKYRLMEPRYSNDGIARHFEFDAMIIGTSMSQNFKTSQFDELFGVKSVKLPYEGAGYEELSLAVDRALERNPEVNTVLWVLDYNGLLRRADWSQYDDYPNYLYDDNPFNDFPYILNKDVLLHGVLPDLIATLKGDEPTSMDEYSSWDMETGPVAIYRGRHEKTHEGIRQFTDEDRMLVEDTFEENIIKIVKKYPNVHFYMYFTPYSIYNWEALDADGNVERTIAAQKVATIKLLGCENISLYTFFEDMGLICDLYNYRDEAHYDAHINELILERIKAGEGLVTIDNYEERIENQRIAYTYFDYDTYFNTLEDFVEQMRLNG